MTNETNKKRLEVVPSIGCAAFAVVLMLIAYTDFMAPAATDISDYTCTFYVASRLMIEGRLAELYPLPTDTRLEDTAYNKAAHKILPALPPNVGAAQFYPPLVPLLFSPLAFLPSKVALFLFQIVSIAAVALSARLVCAGKSAEVYFFCAFLFTPMIVAIWIGQSDVIIGLFPYTLMYWFLSRNKPISAGMAASIGFLKANLMIVPGLIAVIFLCRRQWRMFAGVCFGAAIIVLLNLLIFGPSTCKGWLVDVKLMEADFLNPTSGAARHLAASLPRLLIFLAPPAYVASCRIALYLWSAIIGLIGLAACRTLTKESKEDMDIATIAFVTASLLLPLCAAYLFYYDLCVLAVAGMIVFSRTTDNPSWTAFMRRRCLALWIIMSIYPFSFILSHNQMMPLVVLIPFAIVYLDLLRFVWLRPALPVASTADGENQDVIVPAGEEGA